jgi:hypothetical protein
MIEEFRRVEPIVNRREIRHETEPFLDLHGFPLEVVTGHLDQAVRTFL